MGTEWAQPLRILFCGSRDYDDPRPIDACLADIFREHPDAEIINGGAPGADTIAAMHALKQGFHVETYMADWDTYGRGAGPIRNKQMLDSGLDFVYAFVNKPRLEDSRGTANMVGIAREAGVETLVINTYIERRIEERNNARKGTPW
jgi:hypothetical protein